MSLSSKIKELDWVRHRGIFGYGMIAVGLVILFIGLGYWVFTQSMRFFLLGIPIIIIGVFIAKGTLKRYKELYKDLFVKRPLEENFDNLYYDWTSGFSKETVESFQICEMGYGFYSEDLIQASYLGIPFEMSDVLMSYSSSGSDDGVININRRFLVTDLPNKYLNTVQVFSKTYNFMPDFSSAITTQNVELESVEFNNDFLIRAINPHDAFYLLTPQLMEQIMTYRKRCKNIALHACGNKIVLALDDLSGDSFDADSHFKKVSYQEESAKINKEINDIKAFISIIKSLDPGTSETDEAKTLQPGGFLIEHKANKHKYSKNTI